MPNTVLTRRDDGRQPRIALARALANPNPRREAVREPPIRLAKFFERRWRDGRVVNTFGVPCCPTLFVANRRSMSDAVRLAEGGFDA